MTQTTKAKTSGAVVSLMLSALAGLTCSGEARNTVVARSSAQTRHAANAPSARSTPRDDKNAVCALMPLNDVATLLAPALALQRIRKGAPSESPDYSMCHYAFPGEPKVAAGVELTDLQTTNRAGDAFRAQHDMYAQRTDVIRELANLTGYGDAAFVTDEPGIYSAAVSVRTGSFILRTVVAVDEQPFSFRLPLAEALAKEVLRRRH